MRRFSLIFGILFALGCGATPAKPVAKPQAKPVAKPAATTAQPTSANKPPAPRAPGEEKPPNGYSVHKEHEQERLGADPK